MLAQKFGVAIPEDTDGTPEDARRDASAARGAPQSPRDRGSVLPRAARRSWPAPAHDASSPIATWRQRPSNRSASAYAAGFRPTALKTAAAETRLPAGPAAAGRTRSCSATGGERGRSVPQQGWMVPICRDTGRGDCLRRPSRWIRTEAGAEVPEFPGNGRFISRGRTLYGLSLTESGQIRAARLSPSPVEGHFDFAQVFRSQAAPGRRLLRHGAHTSSRRSLLRRFTTKAVLSYDPDAAGHGAAARSCELLGRRGLPTSTSRSWIRGKIPIHTFDDMARADTGPDWAVRGHTWNTCSTRRLSG